MKVVVIVLVAALALAGASVAQTFTPARDELVSARVATMDQAEAWAAEFLALNPAVAAYEFAEPGHVVITTPSGAQIDMYLDNLLGRLGAPAEQRGRVLADYEASFYETLASLDDRAPEADPANILPILRHTDFLTALNPAPASGEEPIDEPVHRPFAGDVEAILAYDTPRGIGVMGKLSLGIDGLSDDEAFALAVSNFEAFAEGLAWREQDGLRFAVLDGNYESSVLLLPGVWDALEAELGGPAAVAVPTRSVVAVARADDAAGLARLRALIADATFDPYSVSEDLFVRRDGGWAVLE
jgi:uncharacterized protein YtpQ (UPF0354 family)